MSNPNDPFGGVMESIARLIQQHQSAPPHIQSANRLGLGTFLLTGCSYVAASSPVFLGNDIRRLIAVAVHTPSQAPFALWDRNIIEDYAASASRVVNLRGVAS